MNICNYYFLYRFLGFPGGTTGKEPARQIRRHERRRFDPWFGKIPWRKAQQPTPVFLPGEPLWTEKPGGLQSIGSQNVGHDWSDLAHIWFLKVMFFKILACNNIQELQLCDYYPKKDLLSCLFGRWLLQGSCTSFIRLVWDSGPSLSNILFYEIK